jgi:iron complex transport system substrate-binding protein
VTKKTLAVAAAAAVTLLALAGCSGGESAAETSASASGASSDTFPVTIEHVFGETTIPEQPTRVVTWGWGSSDAAIALGVVPVAIPFDSYAGDDEGVLPWIREAVEEQGAELPTILPSSAEEPPYEDIAAETPDLILANYSGITEEQYGLLSKIAPTVAYPDQAWSTPWRDVITTVGEALGKSDEADAVLQDIDAQVSAAADAHPEFRGKSIAAVVDTAGVFSVYKKEDPRVAFLLDLGFTSAPSVDELANGDSTFYYTLSYEQLDKLESDVILAYAGTEEDASAFQESPQDAVIPAVASGNYGQLVGADRVAAVSPPTALSATWGLDELVDTLAEAVEGRG